MRLSSEVLLRQPLGGQGVLGGIGYARDLDLVHGLRADLQLEWLAVLGAPDELAGDHVAGTDLGVGNLLEVGDVSRYDDLDGTLATTVVELKEEEVLTTEASGAGPATDADKVTKVWLVVAPERSNTSAISVGKQRLLLGLDLGVTVECVLNGATVAFVDGSVSGSGCGSISGSLSGGTGALGLGLSWGGGHGCLFCLSHLVICCKSCKGECFCLLNFLLLLGCDKSSRRTPLLIFY